MSALVSLEEGVVYHHSVLWYSRRLWLEPVVEREALLALVCVNTAIRCTIQCNGGRTTSEAGTWGCHVKVFKLKDQKPAYPPALTITAPKRS